MLPQKMKAAEVNQFGQPLSIEKSAGPEKADDSSANPVLSNEIDLFSLT